jgi:hypothetical protein
MLCHMSMTADHPIRSRCSHNFFLLSLSSAGIHQHTLKRYKVPSGADRLRIRKLSLPLFLTHLPLKPDQVGTINLLPYRPIARSSTLSDGGLVPSICESKIEIGLQQRQTHDA